MRSLIFVLLMSVATFAQTPPIEPGVSQELARWRAARYSDVRYKVNLTLEKMSPVLKGTMEIRVVVRDAGTGGRGDAGGAGRGEAQSVPPASAGGTAPGAESTPIILDWRKIKGFEDRSTLSNVSLNGRAINTFEESNEHLVFREGVVTGENVIKLDFTSPILPSGSAITRYIDKEDGSEYIYSLFVPSDASTAFPVFDQPDLKARFELSVTAPYGWSVVANNDVVRSHDLDDGPSDSDNDFIRSVEKQRNGNSLTLFGATEPISSYVFAFAAGEFATFNELDFSKSLTKFRTPRTKIRSRSARDVDPKASGSLIQLYQVNEGVQIYVRKSQLAKFQPHAAEVFRLNREGVKSLEEYFNYKFPFPKYDLVLIPEFPFGGMEHAGATFLRESSVIFPSEPTKNDHISRANLIFHEAAHQWFGDTVTMRWFDDLWLKEGFAEFMAYKTLERVMPEYNAWKAFYERNKQSAYLTDSTKGTTPIYQEIKNLSAAKSAYGNIVYRKAPSFLKQAEFYIGAEKFQTAVRAFLKKHEFANAGWEDLVGEFGRASGGPHSDWAKYWTDWSRFWVSQGGLPNMRVVSDISHSSIGQNGISYSLDQADQLHSGAYWSQKVRLLLLTEKNERIKHDFTFGHPMGGKSGFFTRTFLGTGRYTPKSVPTYKPVAPEIDMLTGRDKPIFIFPNFEDYGYGIFLLDPQSRDFVLKNIQSEKDEFLRSMMWGSLWDSVREGELDPKEYAELVIKNLTVEKDETTTQAILGRVSTAMTYYIPDKDRDSIAPRLEAILIEKMRRAPTLGQRITYYRALLNVASTENARSVLKAMLTAETPRRGAATGGNLSGSEGVSAGIPLKTKDRFDIVTKLASLADPDAERLLAELEKTEISDDAKRYAYAARAAFPTKETKEKYWNDFVNNKQISESWIDAAFGPFNSVRHADLTLAYLERALSELPNHKRNRKIFFVNGWLAAFIGGQKSEEALAIVNKFLADNPNLDRDLRLKIFENVDVIERAVKIRGKFATR